MAERAEHCVFVPTWMIGSRAARDHALRFKSETGTGGLKPYLHVRRDIMGKGDASAVLRLVERGEERDVDGARMFGVVS